MYNVLFPVQRMHLAIVKLAWRLEQLHCYPDKHLKKNGLISPKT
ncbi:hypothetical protein PRUB_b0291 [Pseudoalteromonas rubra]|uniref:Uncharacterized protein n=1 Tax=Pseudoalteromonas rubra TaxID=43658 RepID=A0A8T0C1F6_9GAMM|nr:hypothetical protein PRUB_b0291 [Pseudoalteromonas rubra]